MPDPQETQDTPVLLIDAAGPLLVTGLLNHGGWICRQTSEGGILEHLKSDLETVLETGNLRLEDLRGCFFAEGPGSTLGLRLAALFLKGLKEVPALSEWNWFTYNNLALAAAARSLDADIPLVAMAAPWRKDLMHHVEFNRAECSVQLGTSAPDAVRGQSVPVVELGRRTRLSKTADCLNPYPWERIPHVLAAFPDLLKASGDPEPYIAITPEFARWNALPHASR